MLHEMSLTDYLAHPAIGRSDVDDFIKARSPRHYQIKKLGPRKSSEAMDFGTLVHLMILEPEKVDELTITYFENKPIPKKDGGGTKVVYPKSRQGEKFPYFQAAHPDKTVILEKERDLAPNLVDAFSSHPNTSGLLGGAELEKVALFEWDGIPCKVKMDIFKPGIIWDIKTTSDASEEGFGNSIRTYYKRQAAWYVKAAELAGLGEVDFGFIAMEKTPPFEIALYIAGDELIQSGLAEIEPALRELHECNESGIFPGYPQEIKEVNL